MNGTINSLNDSQYANNDGVIGGYRTLSKDDIFAQTRYLANSNEFESWQVNTEQDECNTYLEEYD